LWDRALGEGKRQLIFAECKTNNAFEKKDIDRMSLLANSFPGAVIVFATLQEHLTKPEIRLIEPFASKGRRYSADGRSHNPVLVLTSTELYSNYSLMKTWKQKGGRYQDLAARRRLDPGLLPLCDLTQQLYLGMPSFGEWDKKRWEQRKLSREKSKRAT